MRKNVHKFGVLGTALAFAVVSGSTVLALPTQARVQAQSAATATTAGSTTGSTAEATARANAQTRLASGKLKACQNRQQAITNIMTRIADRGQKQLTLFGTIATRTETFYTSKGKTLSTYTTLVADVNAAQTAAQAAVNTIRSDSTGFSCDGTDPRGFVSSFQTSLKSEIAALQAYRTAVKNLIVGVKSVQSTTATTNTTTTTKTTGGN